MTERGSGKNLTKAQRDALAWFEQNGAAHLFGRNDPTRIIRKRLRAAGFIEECGSEAMHGAQFFRMTRYQISEAGRAALKEKQS
jgi:hypothetical protein